MSRDPEIVRKAAEAVARLAERTAKRGHGQDGQKGKGWEMSHDLLPQPINSALLREAQALYLEAIRLHATGWYHWQRALLLRELGEFDEAVSAFQACVDCGDYVNQAIADQQINMCRKLMATPSQPQDAAESRGKMALQATAEMFRAMGPQGDVMAELFSRMMSPLEGHNARTEGTQGQEADDTGTSRPPLTEAECTLVCEFGEDFAWRLVRSDWKGAHALLNQTLRKQLSAAKLRDNYTDMTSYAETAFSDVEAQPPENNMPDMTDSDVAWVYVAISSEDANEAVTLMICREDGDLRVRDVEWGRP